MFEIKVLHVISGNDNGGGGQHVINICSSSEKNFDNVICCIGKGPLFEKVQALGLRYLYCDKITARNFLSFIHDEMIDIINFHGPKANFMHYYYHNKIKLPCVTTVHSDYRYDFLNNKLKYILYTPLNIIALKRYKYFICVSEELKYLMDSKGFKGEKAVVKNGIDFDNIIISEEPDEIRKSYNIGSDDFVYVYIARMHPIKNHLNLMKAFIKLSSEYNDIKLLLVGDGILEEELKKVTMENGLDDKVIFAGYSNHTLDFINASQISLLVSLNEGGIPTLTMLESGAVKKAMICSDIGGFKNIIDENSGFLVDPNKAESIYEKMKEAYAKRSELNIMGENFYEYLKNNYSAERFIDSYMNFYKTIVNSR